MTPGALRPAPGHAAGRPLPQRTAGPQGAPLQGVADRPVVLVLASGRGTRFTASGGQGSKLQAPLAGRTVLGWTLAAVRASGLPWHLEAAGHAGMGDSLAAAVRATAGAPGWLVLPGDLPLLQPQTLGRLACAPAALEVVVPVVGGQRGHPVRFAPCCGPALMALHGPQGAKAVVQRHGATLWPTDDIGCIFDIDTVQDLARAGQWLAARQAAAAPGQGASPGHAAQERGGAGA